MKPPPDFVDKMLATLEGNGGLFAYEARLLLSKVHRLDRVRLAALSGYALGLAVNPRHTQLRPEDCPAIYPDHQAQLP